MKKHFFFILALMHLAGAFALGQQIVIDSVVVDSVSCNGLSDGKVHIYVSGGSGNLVYWLFSFDGDETYIGPEKSHIFDLWPANTYLVRVSQESDANNKDDQSIAIDEPDPLDATAVLTNITCNGGSDGAIDLSPDGGTPPYVFSWTTADGSGLVAADQNQTGLTAGTYDVTVTDANGCTFSDSYTLTEPDPLDASAVLTNISCFGGNDGAIDLSPVDGSPPYSYNWTTADGSGLVAADQDQTGLTPGTYDVTVTDANGCTFSDSHTLTEPDPLDATAVLTNISCFGGSNGAIDLSPVDGTPPYSYNWTTADGSGLVAADQNQTGLTAGTYDVTVTDANGCTFSDSYTLTEPDPLDATAVLTNISCFGGSNGAIDLSPVDGTPPYTYNWTTADGSGLVAADQNQTGLTAGTYDVTVTDANGCTFSDSYTLTEPAAALDATATLSSSIDGLFNINCNGDNDGSIDLSVSGGTAGYSFSWSTPDGSGLVAGAEDQLTLTAGTYNVTITDANGCTFSGNYTLTEPDPLDASALLTNISCFGGSNGAIDLSPVDGSPPYSYNWTTADGSGLVAADQDQTGLTPGTYNVTVTDANGCTFSDSHTLTEPDPLDATAVLTNISCFGGSNGAIDLSPVDGTPPYSYNWTTADGSGLVAADQNQTGLTAGTYDVTVTDANGCTFSDSYTLTEPAAALDATATLSSSIDGLFNINCNGDNDGSIDLSVSGGTAGYSFSWSTPDGSGLVAGAEDQLTLTAGTYNVTITDANGCTFSGNYTLTEPDPLDASALLTNISCTGAGDGEIDLSPVDGSPPYSYNWTTADGSGLVAADQDQTGLTPGTYNVTVTDANGCTFSDSHTLTEPDPLDATAVLTNISCFGGSNGAIDLSPVDGTPPYSYNWTTADGSGLVAADQNQTGLTAGTYDVTVTDANGCTFSDSYTLTEPAAALDATATLSSSIDGLFNINCNGDNDGSIDLSVSGGTAGYSFSWSTPDGSGLVAGAEDQLTLTAGTYNVTITDANGCTFSGNYTLTEPDPLDASALLTNISCTGAGDGEIDLSPVDGSPPYSYNWTTADGSGLVAADQDQTGLTPGTYDVTVTDANGCTFSDSHTLTEPDPLDATAVLTNISCFGGSNGAIDLSPVDGTPPYSYNWTTADGSGLVAADQNQTGLTAGTYDVTVTDANGCTFSDSYTLTEPDPLDATAVLTNISCLGGSNGAIDLSPVDGTPPYSYNWTTADGSGLVAADQNQTGLTAGTYDVTVTDANGCTFSDSYTLTEPAAALDATATLSSSIDGLFNINCNGDNDGSIDLSVSGGTAGYSFSWSTPDGSGLVAGAEDQLTLTAGTYNVTITDANGCTFSGNYTLTEPDPLDASALLTNISCFGGSNGAIDLSPVDGSPPYSYNWTTADGSGLVAADQDQTGLTPGSYDVTVTDANGCTFLDSHTLTEPDPLDATAVLTNISCFGGSNGAIDLSPVDGTPPYSYNWTTADGSGLVAADQDQTGLTPGTYDVTVTDANGCTFSDSHTLTEPDPLDATAVLTNISCFGGSNGAIDLSPVDGTPPYSYNWTTADGSGLVAADQNQTGLTAGTYDVTVTDANGCTFSDSYTLTEPAAALDATATLSSSIDGLFNINCNGDNDGSIDLSVSGGTAGYSFSWSTPDGSGLVAGAEDQLTLTAGTYNVTITDANGCTFSGNYTLTEPDPLDASALLTNISCTGAGDGEIDLSPVDGSPPYSYNWTTADGSGLVAADQDQTGLTPGTYNVTVTDANGCTFSDSHTLTEPDPLDATAVLTNISCFGGSNGAIDLSPVDGTPPYSYNWTTADGSGLVAADQNQTGLTAGTYDVTVTDANGCTFSDSYTLTEPAAALDATATLSSSIDGLFNINCNGDNDGSIDLSVSGGTAGYSFSWSTPDGSGLVAGAEDQLTLTAGTYNVTITDANGCTFSGNYTLTEPDPLDASALLTNISCTGAGDGEIDLSPVDGSPPYSYNWTTADGSGLVAADQDQTGLTPGTYNVTVTDANGCTFSDSHTLTEPDPLDATAVLTNISCFGGSNGAIDLSPVDGTPPYSYNWTTADGSGLVAADQNQTGLTAGTYDVTVTDANGCTFSDSYTLTEPAAALDATATLSSSIDGLFNINCNGDNDGSIDLSVSGGTAGYSFSWSTPDGSGLVAGAEDQLTLTAGTYNVTITDANGCTFSGNYTLTEPDPLDASALLTNISCTGAGDGEIDLSPVDGSPPYSYNWTTADGSGLVAADQDQTGLTPGTYNVTVTDANGCTFSDSHTLTEPDPLDATAVLTNISCFGGSNGAIDLSPVDGTPPYSYNWTTADGSGLVAADQNQTGLTAGTYDVTVTDANGCTFSDSYTLTEPAAALDATATLSSSIDGLFNINCNGDNDGSIDLSVSGGTAGYSFSWSTPDGSGLVAGAEDQLTLTAGTYNVTITDANGCTFSGNYTLTEPDPLDASALLTNISCTGAGDGEIDLSPVDGSPPYSYNWTTADGSGLVAADQDQTGLTPGTYDVTVTDANGCTFSDSHTLTEPDPLDATAVLTNISCLGGSNGAIDLSPVDGTPPYSYNWTTADGSGLVAADQNQTGLTAGTYDVTVTDANGCTFSDSYTLTEPAAALDATATLSSSIDGLFNINCNGDNDGSIDLSVSGGTAGYSFSWSTPDGSGLVAGAEDQLTLTAGTYNVTITDANGCTFSGNYTLTEPDPLDASALLTNISCTGAGDGEIDLSPVDGSPPYSYNWTTADGSGLVAADQDQTGLTPGTYNVTVTDANGCTFSDSHTLTEPDPLDATAVLTNISCFGGSNGAIDLSPVDGTPPYSYNWTTADGSGLVAADQNQTGLTAGTYDVTVTDANGCTFSDSYTLTEPAAALDATATLSSSIDGLFNINCNGDNDGSIDLSVSGGTAGYSFSWSTPDGSGLVAGAEDQLTLTAGTYNVTITDANGCTFSGNYTLTEPDPLDASALLTNISCTGAGDGEIDLSPVDGSPPYSYNWTTADGSGLVAADQDQTGLTPGTYNVTVTDANGCTFSDSHTLTEPDPLDATAVLTNISCFGGSNGAIDLSPVDGTPPYSYNWTTADGSGLVAADQNQTGLTAGTYDVTVTDANGCTFSDSYTLTEPAAALDATATLSSSIDGLFNINCNGDNDGSIDLSVSGGTAGYSFSWSTPDGSGLVAGAEDQLTLTAGTYNVTITDANGCTFSGNYTLTEPDPLDASALLTNISCTGAGDGEIDLSPVDGSPPYSYNWTTADGSGLVAADQDQTGLTPGTYDVTVTDANGCTFSDSHTLTEPDPLDATAVLTNISCFGGSNGAIDLSPVDGTPPYSYNWTTADGSGLVAADQNQTGLTAGTYDVTVTDANGCTFSDSYTLTEPAAALDATATLSSSIDGLFNINCNGDADGSIILSVNGGTTPYSINWTTADGSGLATTDQDQTGLIAGTYDITITDANGCTYIDSYELTEPDSLAANATLSNISCNGLTDGAIDISITGGVPDYTISWSTVDGSGLETSAQDQTNLSAGTYNLEITDENSCNSSNSYTITEPGPISIDSTKTVQINCHNANTGEITVYASGGTMPLNYSIDPSVADDNSTGLFTDLPSGNYIITVNDAKGCPAPSSNPISITQPDPLVEDSVLTHKITCNNASDGRIIFYVSGGVQPYEYSIDNQATFQSNAEFNNLNGGAYELTVRDARGCQLDMGTYTLINPDPITITPTVSDVTTCAGDATGSITATAFGGRGPLEYSTDGLTFQSTGAFNNLTAGNYTVFVRDSMNCQTNTNVIINEPDPVTATITSTNYEDGVLGSITISGESGGTPPYEYSIEGVSGTFSASPVFNNLQAGVYDVVVQDVNGCSYREQVEILEYSPLSVSINATDVTCFGANNGSITLHPSDESGTVNYSIDGGNTFTTDTLFSNLNGDSLYHIQAYDESGKEFYDSVFISEPDEIIVNKNILPAECNVFSSTGSVNLDITGGVGNKTVTWSNGSNEEDLSNIASGWYYFNVTDEASCVKSDSAYVAAFVIVEANAGRDTTVCQGSTFSLNGSYGSVVSWEPRTYLSNQTIPNPVVYNINEPTTYVYSVSEVASGFNCYNFDTITIGIQPVYGISVNHDTTMLHGQTAQLAASSQGTFTSYEWVPSTGLSDNSSDSPLATPEKTTTYYLLATNDNGCVETDSVTIEIIQDLRISNVFSPNDDNLNDYFYIENVSSFPNIQIEIYSRWGERVYFSNGYEESNRWNGEFKNKDVPVGTYYYIVIPFPGAEPIKGNVTVIR